MSRLAWLANPSLAPLTQSRVARVGNARKINMMCQQSEQLFIVAMRAHPLATRLGPESATY